MGDNQPWLRQDREPALWYDRFTHYRRLGPQRTLLGAYRAATKAQKGASGRAKTVPGAWQKAFQEWSWKERAEAYDQYRRNAEEREWNKRYTKQRETEWALAQDLVTKAKQMLSMPLVKTTRTVEEDGRLIITEVEPARWAFRDAAGYIETASKLARLAAGKPTAETRIVLGEDDLGNLRELSDEQLSAIYHNLALLIDAASHPRDVGDGPPAPDPGEPPELGDPAPA